MKKLALITFCGMLALGASSYITVAQDMPTGAPDTSVTARPSTPKETPASTPAKSKESKQNVGEKSESNNGVAIGIIAAVLVVGLGVVLVTNKKKSKKQ